jgi:flagellar basal-body rod protein FlgC
MSFSRIVAVSAGGMTAQRARLNVLASNLANVHTTRTAAGGPYRRQEVVFRAEPLGPEEATIPTAARTESPKPPLTVRVVERVADPRPPILRYEPEHPDANTQGYVAYPNINPLEEMVNMLSATRSYEANLSVLKTAKQLNTQTIELLKV